MGEELAILAFASQELGHLLEHEGTSFLRELIPLPAPKSATRQKLRHHIRTVIQNELAKMPQAQPELKKVCFAPHLLL